jgi:hypothetical protein
MNDATTNTGSQTMNAMTAKNEHIEIQIGLYLLNLHRAINKIGTAGDPGGHLAGDVERASDHARNVENRVRVLEHIKAVGRRVAVAL